MGLLLVENGFETLGGAISEAFDPVVGSAHTTRLLDTEGAE
jgi:hypothetical protein